MTAKAANNNQIENVNPNRNVNPSSLHIVSNTELWVNAQLLLSPGDVVVFIQDAVYLLPSIDTNCGVDVYARELDCQARNIVVAEQYQIVDDNQWVVLCENAQNILSW